VTTALLLGACSSTPTASGPSATAATLPTTSTPIQVATIAAAPSASAPPAGCRLTPPKPGSQVAIYDYVDFVVVGSTTYLASSSFGSRAAIRPTAASEIGPVVETVRCRFEDIPHTYTPPKQISGDAAFLKPGTELHSAAGYDPTCRVVIPRGTGSVTYIAIQTDAKHIRPQACGLAPAQ